MIVGYMVKIVAGSSATITKASIQQQWIGDEVVLAGSRLQLETLLGRLLEAGELKVARALAGDLDSLHVAFPIPGRRHMALTGRVQRAENVRRDEAEAHRLQEGKTHASNQG